MPEYITKNEPVDNKPYIVYTDDKRIVYAGDPDADIPGGGGGTVKCYIVNTTDMTTAYSQSDVTVQAFGGTSIATEVDQVTVEGETANCLSFTANIGASYYIGKGDLNFVEGDIAPVFNTSSSLPSKAVSDGFFFVSPDTSFIAFVKMSR